MKYFSAKTIGGRGGYYGMFPAESLEEFKNKEEIKDLEKIWKVEYKEITEGDYNKFNKYLESMGGKIVDIHEPDDYSKQVLENFNYNLKEILEAGFDIRGNPNNGFPIIE